MTEEKNNVQELTTGSSTLSNQDVILRAALAAVTTVVVTTVATALTNKVQEKWAARKTAKLEVVKTK